MTVPHRHYAIVLAAGASTRMGTCKAALPWANGTLLSYQVEQLLLADIMPLVVLAPHNVDRQQDCLPGSQVVINPSPRAGKTSSILAGLKHLPQSFDSFTISAVDQPRPDWIYQTLVQANIAAADMLITAPTHQGRMGHPLFFSRAILPQFKNLNEATLGLRQIVKDFHQQMQRVEFDTPEVLVDLNTPESYQAQFIIQKLHPPS